LFATDKAPPRRQWSRVSAKYSCHCKGAVTSATLMFTPATATFSSINDTPATQYKMQILYGVAATFRATLKVAVASVNTKVADVTAP